jgi:hypothetical protein
VKLGFAQRLLPGHGPKEPARSLRSRVPGRALAALWHRHLGRPALVALLLLGAAVFVQWQLRPGLLREQQRLELRQQALLEQFRSRGGEATPVVADPPAEQGLPPTAQRGRDLQWLVTAAQRGGLVLDRADYALGAATRESLTRVEASLPLTGTYSAVRQFIAAALNEMPHAALESLQIERPNTQSPQLQATLRLVLFYRQGTP